MPEVKKRADWRPVAGIAGLAALGYGGYKLYEYFKAPAGEPPGPPEPPVVEKASIYGKVTDSQTALPIEGALISVYAYGKTVVLYEAPTDANGEYSIADIEPGKYMCYAWTPARPYITAELTITLSAGQRFPWDVRLEPLLPPAPTSGNVTDARTGEPIEGATIIFESYSVDPYTGMTDLRVVATDAQGNYSTALAPPTGATETYKLAASAWPNYQSFEKDVQVIPYQSNVFDFQMTEYFQAMGNGTLQGTVTDSKTVAKLQGVEVVIKSWGPGPIDSQPYVTFRAVTDALGYYKIEGIPEIMYGVTALHPDPNYDMYGPVKVTVSGITTHNFTMRIYVPPTMTAQIYGKVTDSETGAALAGVQVGLSAMGAGWETATNSQGNYTFANLPPSTEVRVYWLTFMKTGYKSVDIKNIWLEDGEVKQINTPLTPVPAPGVGSVYGRVVDWNGNPVAGAEPWFMTLDEAYDYWTKTDTAGYYSIANMAAPQTYRCGCLAPGVGAGRAYPVPNFTLAAGQDKLVDFTIMPSAGG